jgi:hypothetical protein
MTTAFLLQFLLHAHQKSFLMIQCTPTRIRSEYDPRREVMTAPANNRSFP